MLSQADIDAIADASDKTDFKGELVGDIYSSLHEAIPLDAYPHPENPHSMSSPSSPGIGTSQQPSATTIHICKTTLLSERSSHRMRFPCIQDSNDLNIDCRLLAVMRSSATVDPVLGIAQSRLQSVRWQAIHRAL